MDATSAGPQLPGVTYYGIEATHSNMCKFESENAPGYRTVSTALREWVADAPNLIPIRWGIEEEERQVRANLENMERARPYVRLSLEKSRDIILTSTSREQQSSPLHTDKSPVGFYQRGMGGTRHGCPRGKCYEWWSNKSRATIPAIPTPIEGPRADFFSSCS